MPGEWMIEDWMMRSWMTRNGIIVEEMTKNKKSSQWWPLFKFLMFHVEERFLVRFLMRGKEWLWGVCWYMPLTGKEINVVNKWQGNDFWSIYAYESDKHFNQTNDGHWIWPLMDVCCPGKSKGQGTSDKLAADIIKERCIKKKLINFFIGYF